MATIQVDLNEDDIRAACMYWATRRVLNEGTATDCSLAVTVCNGKATGKITRVTVYVETDRMKHTPTRAEAGAGDGGEG